MTDSIHFPSPQPTGHPLRGTQPLAGPQGSGASKPVQAPAKAASAGDTGAIASGAGALDDFLAQGDALTDLKAQAEALLRQLDPLEQAVAERLFQDIFDPPAVIRQKVEQLRDYLQQILHRLQAHVHARIAERQFVENRISFAWAMILQSLERYIENLETGKLVERSFLERRLNDQQSENEHDERLMVATQGLAPEQRFTLLSAALNQK